MYACVICGASVRTRQGLAGHHRFRHEGTRFESNYRPKTSSVERKLDELAGTVVSLDATVHEFAMDMLAFEALLVKIASQLGVDVEADIESLSAKLAIRRLRASRHDVSSPENSDQSGR